MEYRWCYVSALGLLTLTGTEEALTGLYLRPPTEAELRLREEADIFRHAAAWLDAYFRGDCPDPKSLNLAPRGSDFRRLVWSLLLEIPPGQTRTYGELAALAAARMGVERMSAQAIGGAVGSNPISIIIPCHRVVAAGNKLGGFGWGPEAKLWLLRHEGGYHDH